jgi:hypothetical protein
LLSSIYFTMILGDNEKRKKDATVDTLLSSFEFYS